VNKVLLALYHFHPPLLAGAGAVLSTINLVAGTVVLVLTGIYTFLKIRRDFFQKNNNNQKQNEDN
jgi:hypothetical protein